jgi:hypothetical protein
MPFNLTKIYNQLLEIDHLAQEPRTTSLSGIFNRDFINSQNNFRSKPIRPIPKDGKDTMEVLFDHLTKKIYDKSEMSREFDPHRSKRLHWIKFHIDERRPDRIKVFSCLDKAGPRTYIYDETELYVIILEPYRDASSYYLITAYHLDGKNVYKIKNKIERKLDEIL